VSGQIANSWASATLEDIAELLRGVTFPTTDKRHQQADGLVACLRTTNVQATVEWEDLWFIPEHHVKHSKQFVRIGDVLISTANSYELVGKVARVTALPQRSTLGAFISALRAHSGVDAKFLYHQMAAEQTQRAIRDMSSTTTNISNVSGAKLRLLPLKVAPAAEQTRIVEKLEELLSELDAGVAELKAAQKKLKQYRQSLLKAAVNGSLTAAWRARPENAAPAETGTQLLARILKERRARWEARQLAKFEAQGKAPSKGWQGKYQEPVKPRSYELNGLPEGWAWATLSQIGWLDRGRSKHRPRNAPHLYGGPYPFVQTGDIRHADTYLRDVEASYSEAGLSQSRLWPVGTLCITIAANIGKTAILDMQACFPDSVVGFLPVSSAVSVRYVEYFMRSAQALLEDDAPATAQKNINLETLERLCIPLPPENEIGAVVQALNCAFGGIQSLEAELDLRHKQSTAQRQNILRAAFSGQLVPQDPADEPASVLLARIRAERATRTAPPKTRRPRSTLEPV
jgi:type I restriction enzyme S subunit